MFTSITINNIIIISFFYYDVLLCEFEMMVYCSLAWSVNNISDPILFITLKPFAIWMGVLVSYFYPWFWL